MVFLHRWIGKIRTGRWSKLNEELGISIAVKEYDSLTALVDGLFNGETNAVILNSAYLDVLEEMEGYEDIRERLREVTVTHVETEVPQTAASDQETASSGDQTVFAVYISGVDTRSTQLIANSRCDVNILAVINADTRQVVLISTPRDYYVPLSISDGVPDKLTHAGIYGVQVSMDTLSMLYDTPIEYYFRVNFTGFKDIIDALGGVTVVSDYTFDTKNVAGYHFDEGENYMDGDAALAFLP
ncbi:MAG: LCP family protein [Lachnospiraceae bacterium]